MSNVNFEFLWGAIPYPAFVLDAGDNIITCNSAAESFAAMSLRQISGKPLANYVGKSSALIEAADQARRGAGTIVLHGIDISWQDRSSAFSTLHVSNLPDGQILLMLQPRGVAEKMDRRLSHRSAARSVSGMAAMLAHEIRNPLAGIKGAAQLLAMGLSDEDAEMTTMIEEEIARIGKLVDRMEQFGDLRPAQREAVNIHDILDRAKRAAEVGFAEHAKFNIEYDPSLPPVSGDPDQLLQVFQNLFKNAAEAIPDKGGQIGIKTAFRPGIRMQIPGRRSESLPLQVIVTDNGHGVPDSLMNDIFDPFVSSKAAGTGLGLSLVSKIIADLGGVVECVSEPGKTQFKILLPIWRNSEIEGKS